MTEEQVALLPARRAGRLPSWITHRWVAAFGLVVLGALTFLPALRCQLLFDDYVHATMIDGTFLAHRSPLDVYNFVDDREHSLLMERGMLPWWSDAGLRIRFLRPLASALRWVEHRAFGRATALFHLHSFAWWAAAVFAARRLYRTVLPERTALLATLVFALAPAHALSLAWLANRETLLSLTFGALALTEHLRWRASGRVWPALAASALFALAMAAGEYALCFGGYVLALELMPGTGARRWWARLGGLTLYGVPAAGYLAIRAALGYGTRGSGLYIDPLHEPLAFLRVLPRRVAQGWLQELLTLDATGLQAWPMWAAGLAAAVLAGLLAIAAHRTAKVVGPAAFGHARWMLVGSLLALVPVAAVAPSPRLLGAALLGLSALLALILDVAWFPREPLGPPRGLVGFVELIALGLGFFQFVHGPVTAWIFGEEFRKISTRFATHAAQLHERLDGDGSLYVLRGGNNSFFLPFAVDPTGKLPPHWSVLAATGHVLALRPDARTVELVVPKDASLFSLESLFRSWDQPVRVGDRFTTPSLTATVLDVDPAGPRRVRFEFSRPLEAAGNVWVTEGRGESFPLATLPVVGFGQPYD